MTAFIHLSLVKMGVEMGAWHLMDLMVLAAALDGLHFSAATKFADASSTLSTGLIILRAPSAVLQRTGSK